MIGWTDAKGQQFSAEYDALSRPARVNFDPNGTSRIEWEWGSTQASYNVGKLKKSSSTVDGTTYEENFTYDGRTRLLQKSITIPGQGTFNYNFGYEPNKGWLDTLTYPVSIGGYRLALKYDYVNGNLQRVSNAATSAAYWTADSTNAFGQITQETLGSGAGSIVTQRDFDIVNGRLSQIQSGTQGNPNNIQNLSYVYDLVGNVTQRANSGLTENFIYGGGPDNDHLYRLEHSELDDGTTTTTNLKLRYDASGSIKTKEELIQAPLVSQTIVWTPDNYPSQITVGSQTASFSYGPDRQRWKMELNDGVHPVETIYSIGGLMEMVKIGSNTTFRHTIVGGSGAVAIFGKSNAGEVLHYLLGDHQGSTDAFVENGSGTVMKASFTAFGLRRDADTWSGEPDANERYALDQITRQGYTYQTVLASMGLNHMNGRVQDAVTGRFLSADPFTTQPSYTQNYNRYGYVYNNPLSFTDPSGFGGNGETEGGDFIDVPPGSVPEIIIHAPLPPLDETATNPETRVQPCSFASGAVLSAFSCWYVNAQVGLGSALAAAAAAAAQARADAERRSGEHSNSECRVPAQTDAQRTLAQDGRREAYFRSRLDAGDPFANRALNTVRNSGLLAVLANGRLFSAIVARNDESGNYMALAAIHREVNQIGVELMQAYSNQLDRPGGLTLDRWTNIHHDVFARHGLPPETYGGTPFAGYGIALMNLIADIDGCL